MGSLKSAVQTVYQFVVPSCLAELLAYGIATMLILPQCCRGRITCVTERLIVVMERPTSWTKSQNIRESFRRLPEGLRDSYG